VTAGEAIVREAGSWPGVTHEPGASCTILRYGGREVGRVVGDARVELVLPPRVRDMLAETGRATAAGGRAVYELGEQAEAVELLRLAYERARVAERVRDARRR
jgi:hypothetical protein